MQTTVPGHDLEERLAAQGIALACPACRGRLGRNVKRNSYAFLCEPCGREYPVVHGIPDFRLEPDRFISIDDDRKKGIRVLSMAVGGSFAEALGAYWSITPELAPALAERHKRRQLAEVEIGERLLNELARLTAPEGLLLDLGCGAAGFLVPAMFRFRYSVGVDVGFRWLLLAQKRLAEHGIATPLICANAEHLPFADKSFDFVLNNDLLEHLAVPGKSLGESYRVLKSGGRTYLATNNRFSLAPEAHVRLLGIGWLPRPLQRGYARFRRGHTYDKVRLLGPLGLRLAARKAFDRVQGPGPAPVPSDHLGAGMRFLGRVYERLRGGFAGALLTPFAPRIQVIAEKRPAAMARLQSRSSGRPDAS